MSKEFHSLTVKEVRPETADAVTISFTIPADLAEAFHYEPGQHLTLRFQLNGKEVRRAYSMCSSPLDSDLAITVKRVRKGIVSNHINDNLKPGQQVEVMPPEGRFFIPRDPEQRRTYYLLGAGSGITPLMSLTRTILEEEPQSSVYLLYGNRNEESIIFRNELAALQQKYKGQFTHTLILSQPKRDKPKGLSGIFNKGTITWEGLVGRIDAGVIDRFLSDHPQQTKTATYFICGPGSMIDTAEAALLARGIDKKDLHAERFISAEPGHAGTISGTAGAMLTAHLNGQVVTLPVPANKTILDVLIDGKHNPPYSCTAGACSSCMAKVLKGSVKMEACYALDDDEVAAGFVLTCQSHPTSAEVEVTYDV